MNYRLPQGQALKNEKPMFSKTLLEIAIAMVLTDATMARVSTEAYMKIEQGYKQLEFVEHLGGVFSNYCWKDTHKVRMDKNAKSRRLGQVKSYGFKTFSHVALTQVYNLCHVANKKTIQEGIIADYITGLGLAYMVMSDGSLHKDNSMMLNLQSFTQEENQIVSKELNQKFGLNSKVISHKKIYGVVQIPARDAQVLRSLIAPFMLPMFAYKIPRC